MIEPLLFAYIPKRIAFRMMEHDGHRLCIKDISGREPKFKLLCLDCLTDNTPMYLGSWNPEKKESY